MSFDVTLDVPCEITSFASTTCLGSHRDEPHLAVDSNCNAPSISSPAPHTTSPHYEYKIGGGTKRVPFVMEFTSLSTTCTFPKVYS